MAARFRENRAIATLAEQLAGILGGTLSAKGVSA